MPEPPPASPADVARAVFAALDARDLDRLTGLCHPDVVDDFLAVGEVRGPVEVRRFFAELLTALPDFSITAEDVIGDHRGAAVTWRTTGTFSGGAFQGVRPNGRRIDLRGIDFMEIESGLVRRNRIAYDGATFARQVGMLPPRGSALDRSLTTTFNTKTRPTAWARSRRAAAAPQRSG
ncbi:ester cyclase [Streptomyces sp. NRRL B-24484]|uniref:ester cyclase n=1 Tax=Streptomyces sp. NRRL B-24484 TaxID=1463833 RepID=UPI0005BD773D|nr:ester cyclase [Streptomyces sp. NRRL B-24484]